MLNALTIVTEFIGVSMALGFLGCPKAIAIPAAAVLLFAVVAGGSFRRWEQLMFGLIAVNLAIIPMALLAHPRLDTMVGGLLPQFPGGLDSTVLLMIVAIVGTTVSPWQLFFQQSNVVDKRITPRWIGYARADLILGIVVVMAGALALMAATAFGLGGQRPVRQVLRRRRGGIPAIAACRAHGRCAVCNPVALDTSVIGANAIGLATTYALRDALGKRHSLHWTISQAPVLYGSYAALLGVSAVIAFSPDHVLGLITQGVQALAGILLPSATVFLVLLCNDRAILGPWMNTGRQNVVAWITVWSLVLMSLALTATTFFPNLSAATLEAGLAAGALLGIVGGGVVLALGRSTDRREPESFEMSLGACGLDEMKELDRLPKLTRAERAALRAERRASWRTPALTTLVRPAMSPTRRTGLFTLRAYLVLAVTLVVIKVGQAGLG